ncbi:hypothetical protein AB0D57_44425 [Streptomyces sp. NPDC048275]|uniref:hypothetical protein n=1 Tax=Streptomyces sp. NPDC048275 TaxID=3155629 RepID=UPI003408DBF8
MPPSPSPVPARSPPGSTPRAINTFLAEVAATGAQFLARCKSTRRPPLLRALSDGSYLSRFGELTVRVIEADIVCVLADGTHVGGRYRLATTLLDPVTDPAERLTRLYAARSEIRARRLTAQDVTDRLTPRNDVETDEPQSEGAE